MHSWASSFPTWSSCRNSIHLIIHISSRNHVLLESIRTLSTQAPIMSLQERQGNILSLETHAKIPQWAAAIKAVVLKFREEHLDDAFTLDKTRHQGMWLIQGDTLFVLVAMHTLTLPETLVAVNNLLRSQHYATPMTSDDLTRPQYVKVVMNILNDVQWPPSKRVRREDDHAE